MGLDVQREKTVLFRQVAKLGVFPKPVTYATVYRWAKYGRVNHSGITVYLEYVKTPHGFATSREACIRFLEALNE